MDDLITRSSVIELVNNFNFVGYQRPNAEVREEFVKALENIPTAYNVDKVNQEIFCQSENIYGEIGQHFGIKQMGVVGTYIKTSKAMEIVKAGGVNE